MPTTETAQTANVSGTEPTQTTPGAAAIASAIVNTEAKQPGEPAVPPETSPTAEETAAAEAAAAAVRAKAAKKASDQKVFDDIRARRSAAERLKRERTAIETERSQYRNEMGQFRSQMQAARTDPIGFLEANGYSPEQLAERVLKRGEELSPQEQASAIAKEAKAEAQALRKELERRDAQQAERESAANRAKWENEYTGFMLSEERHPNIVALWSKGEVLEETRKLAVEALEEGLRRGYTRERIQKELDDMPNEDVGALLEDRAGKRLAAMEARILARKEKEKPLIPKVDALKVPTGGAPTAKTLTNAAASEKATGNVPLDRLPEREQNRILAEQMRRIIASKEAK
jgi:hypothetical protein